MAAGFAHAVPAALFRKVRRSGISIHEYLPRMRIAHLKGAENQADNGFPSATSDTTCQMVYIQMETFREIRVTSITRSDSWLQVS